MTQAAQSPPIDLFVTLFDDAAVFPPGNLPLAEAVPAHEAHHRAPHAAVVGPFVLAMKDLEALRAVSRGLPPRSLALSLTTPTPNSVALSLATAEEIPAVRVASLEVAVPAGAEVRSIVPALREALDARTLPTYIEVPRDSRREPLLRELAGTQFVAKFRTGGERAELYPSEQELAASVRATVSAGVAFKATAGLHHALRNTDPDTGFEQHGFLNLMLATAAAEKGASETELVACLAERDRDRVADAVRCLDPEVRRRFRSVGTCSIREPVTELVDLDLLPAEFASGLVVNSTQAAAWNSEI